MKFKTSTGKVLDDAQLDEMAREYEDGSWEGHGEVSPGRPRLYGEEMETVSFRIPHSRVAAIEAAIRESGISKSEFYRRAIDRELLALS